MNIYFISNNNQHNLIMKDNRLLPVNDETRKEIEIIYREYHQRVFDYVKSVVKYHEDAEDVTTDVFAKLMNNYSKSATRYNSERKGKDGRTSTLSSYIHTVTNKIILDFFRTNHQDRFTAVSDFVNTEGNETFQFNSVSKNTPQKLMENSEMNTEILKAFRGLKPNQKRIATLYFRNEFSYKEIGDMLDIPLGTVKGMLSRARQELQNQLNDLYGMNTKAMYV